MREMMVTRELAQLTLNVNQLQRQLDAVKMSDSNWAKTIQRSTGTSAAVIVQPTSL